MGNNKIDDQGDFNAKISDAVDDLFNAVRQIEIDPATNEVREVGGVAAKQEKEAPVREMESRDDAKSALGASTPAPAAAQQTHEILAKLDQSLMTLDWEVSRSNAGNMRDLLDKASRQYDLGPLMGEGGVISLMHRVLVAMSEAPESVPTSGPLALKSSLTALKSAAQEGQPYSTETRNQLEQARNALLSVLPDKSSGPAAATAPKAAVAAPLPQQLQATLHSHVARLDQLIKKRLQPVENFFGKSASLAKLHVVIKAVRQQLAEQCEQLTDAMDGRYGDIMPVADPVTISIKLGNEAKMLMQYHLQVLNHCARRIAPIEKVFADMEGQEKLHAIHFEIRSGLMAQLQYIAAALDGDFGPLPPLPKYTAAPSALVAQQQEGVEDDAGVGSGSSPTPWPVVMVGRWRGVHIAFIPEQVCFQGRAGIGAGNVGRQPSLKLKKLKTWPWSGLKSKFRGALLEKSNKELAGLEFPVLEIPVSASGRDGRHIVVLFQSAKGGVVVVDSPLEELEIGDQYEWHPRPGVEGDVVCGMISSDFGDPIPVVDVDRL